MAEAGGRGGGLYRRMITMVGGVWCVVFSPGTTKTPRTSVSTILPLDCSLPPQRRDMARLVLGHELPFWPAVEQVTNRCVQD